MNQSLDIKIPEPVIMPIINLNCSACYLFIEFDMWQYR